MATITTIEAQKHNKERANIYLDGQYAFSVTLIEAVKLRKGQILTDGEIRALQDTDHINRAVDQAARFLAHRPRSTHEVRRNLTQKQFPNEVVDTAILHLESLGYLDDEAFARFWVKDRQAFKPRSALALRYELRQKGVEQHIIDLVLGDVDSHELAYQAAQMKARRFRGLDRETFRHKLGGFLQRRGFAYGIIHAVTEQLESELVADDPEFFPDTEG